MQKICILIAVLLFTITAMTQKPNPTIGKNEFEISLFFVSENGQQEIYYYTSPRDLAGAQIVHRWAWKKYTKVGAGVLAGADNYDPIHESDFVPYGALFGDITQFIGRRQKWSVGGQIGHGIFKRKDKRENTNYKAIAKHTAGMYYSISSNYRSIISKKVLMVISLFYDFRNFRHKTTVEYYLPPSVEEHTSIEKYSGPGIRMGIVF